MEICTTGTLPLQAVPLKRQADTTNSGKTISVWNSTVLFLHFMMKVYRMFSCNLNTYIGLLAADTAIMLREADKCPEIHLSAVITGTCFPADTDKVYCALYDDLIKQADNKEMLPEKEIFSNALAGKPYHLLLRRLFRGNAADTHPVLLIPISVK